MISRRAALLAGASAFAAMATPALAALYPVRAFSRDKLGSKELVTSAATGPDNLPSGIIIQPGVYNIFGRSVDMTKEQLYTVKDFNGRAAQVITYASDFDAMITSIAWVGHIGYGDVTYSPAMLAAVRTRDVSTTCGAISAVAQSLLAQVGIASRNVGGAAEFPSDFNGYDDGHTILEVEHGGKRCAIDFLLKIRFMAGDGVTPLSLLDLHDAFRNNLPVVFAPLMPEIAPSDNSDYNVLHTWIRYNPRIWYSRIFGLIYVPVGNAINVMYETAEQQASIPPRGSIPVSRPDFIAAFYAPLPPPVSGNTFVGQQPNTTSGWGALYTVADTNLQLHPGETVVSIGVILASPAAIKPKILQQITTTIFAAMLEFPASHPGGVNGNGAWVDFPLPVPFVVPATGVYRPGWSGNPGSIPFSTIGSRAIFIGDLPPSQSGAFQYATNGGICMRWTKA